MKLSEIESLERLMSSGNDEYIECNNKQCEDCFYNINDAQCHFYESFKTTAKRDVMKKYNYLINLKEILNEIVRN